MLFWRMFAIQHTNSIIDVLYVICYKEKWLHTVAPFTNMV